MSYTPVNWKDLPDKTTPISATNLNHMDNGILEIDTTVGDKSKISGMGDGPVIGAIVAQNETLEECFQYVSDGKALIASAITDKGVTTAEDATFETMAANIAKLGGSGGNVVAIMHQNSVAKSGTMSNCKFSNSDYVSVSSGVFTVKKAGTYHFDAMGLNNYCQLLVHNASVQTWGSGTIAETTKTIAVGDTFYFKNNNTSYTNNMLAVVWVE